MNTFSLGSRACARDQSALRIQGPIHIPTPTKGVLRPKRWVPWQAWGIVGLLDALLGLRCPLSQRHVTSGRWRKVSGCIRAAPTAGWPQKKQDYLFGVQMVTDKGEQGA